MTEAVGPGPGSRRPEVLAAAIKVFAQRGLAGTSFPDVADAAGVTVATVTYHFASKEALFESAMEQVLDELNAVIEAARPTDEATDVEGLGRVVDAVWGWFESQPDSARLYRTHLQAATGSTRDLRDRFVALHVRRAFQYLPAGRPSAKRRLAAQTLALRSLIAALNMVAGAQSDDGPLAGEDNDLVRRSMRDLAQQIVAAEP
ncbi:TetR/AcrR family transcriptional regulator [Sporichthya brevicatena]|uniref:TetR/AcrR family transcriptional regulator n=1 Tax=Sporichthya brevicatena TaxID=171442 RepID=A0ABP3RUP3_9ACTN